MLSITVCSSNSLSTRHASVFSQDSRSMARNEDKETFLVTLTQPRLYVQQIAFDKGEQINSKQRTKSSNLQRCTISFRAKLIVVGNFKDSRNNCGVSVNLITLIQSAYITFSTIIGFRKSFHAVTLEDHVPLCKLMRTLTLTGQEEESGNGFNCDSWGWSTKQGA